MTAVDLRAEERMLAARAAACNREAFDVLVVQHRARATAVAYEWCSDASDVEDVVDLAFLKAYRAIGHFRGECSFSTWLHRIVVNTAIDSRTRCRWKAYEQPLSDRLLQHFERSGRLATTISVDDEEDARRTMLTRIRVGIHSLPQDSRDILNLCYIAKKPYSAIAQILGIKLGTVRSRLNRARMQLRRCLNIV